MIRDLIREAGGPARFVLQAIGGAAMMVAILWGLPILAVAFGLAP